MSLDPHFGFEQHFIRGLAKMTTRAGLVIAVMLAMALGHSQQGRPGQMRSLVRPISAIGWPRVSRQAQIDRDEAPEAGARLASAENANYSHLSGSPILPRTLYDALSRYLASRVAPGPQGVRLPMSARKIATVEMSRCQAGCTRDKGCDRLRPVSAGRSAAAVDMSQAHVVPGEPSFSRCAAR